MASEWLVWQFADSGFPAGGFAHSWGLEAAVQAGEISGAEDLRRFLGEVLWQAGYGGLPLVSAAHRRPQALAQLDARCEAFLRNHVANRASRSQGRAFLSTCEKSFQTAGVGRVAAAAQGLHGHYAPLFGAALKALGFELEQAQRLFLFLALRGVLSAGVRLAVVGPHQAQGLQAAFGAELDTVLSRCAGLGLEDLAQTAPHWDLCQAGHDRLYSRLFQS